MKILFLLVILLGLTASAYGEHCNKKSKQYSHDRHQHHDQSKRKHNDRRYGHETRRYRQQRYRDRAPFYTAPHLGFYLDFSRRFDQRNYYSSSRSSRQIIPINKKVTSIFVHNNEQSTTINRAYATLGNGETIRLSALEGNIRHGHERVLDFRHTS